MRIAKKSQKAFGSFNDICSKHGVVSRAVSVSIKYITIYNNINGNKKLVQFHRKRTGIQNRTKSFI